MDRRKTLKDQYKQMLQEMGLVCMKCEKTGKVYIEATNRTKATINKLIFTLKLGSNRCEELQKEWTFYGKDAFHIEVLEVLEYDKDGLDRDYSEDLELLRMVWVEKLSGENIEMYN